MTFGEELRSISQSLDMEKKIFEEMKKKLKDIALIGHPKGCHVRVQGEFKNLSPFLIEAIEDEEMKYYQFPTRGTCKVDDIIYWGEIGKSYDRISNKAISVFVNEDGTFLVAIYTLSDAYMDDIRRTNNLISYID